MADDASAEAMEMDAQSVASGAARPRKASDRVKMSRDEKDELVNWIGGTVFGDAAARKAWLATKALPRARNVVLAAARRTPFAARAQCLHGLDSTAGDVVTRACGKAPGGHGAALLAHWTKLAQQFKGSKKIHARRAKESKNADRTNFRSKQKKHQSRHN